MRQDTLRNGAWFGLAVGAAIGATYFIPKYDIAGRYAAMFFGLWAAAGTGVGVGLDALVPSRQVIYQPTGAAQPRDRSAALGEQPPRLGRIVRLLTEDTAAAECTHTTGARTLEGLLSVLDGWREAALANPPRRERPARGVSDASLRALEIVGAGRTTSTSRAATISNPVSAPSPTCSCPTSTPRRRARRPRSSVPATPGSYTTPGANPGTGIPRKSRPAGSRSSKPSGTTRHKSHSNRYIPRNTKALGADPETGLKYPERPPSGS